MRSAIRAATLSILSAALGACGGGGGGGGVVVPDPTTTEPPPPASFAAGQSVVMEGSSVALDATVIVSGTTPMLKSGDATIDPAATVKFSFDSAKQLSGISIDTAQASLSFDRNAAGHTIECKSSGLCKAKNQTALALTVDPFAAGWSYQSFGIWAETGSLSLKMGAVSAGGATSANSLPTTGSATFNGRAIGFYVDAGGTLWGTVAAMQADVNFGARSILFSTSNTIRGKTPEDANLGKAEAGLNLSGTLAYSQGVNAFSGSVQTANGELSGQSAGRFFGPKAEEIGGIYSLQGSGLSRMVGGFGGKRSP
jgi:hypothetical protein